MLVEELRKLEVEVCSWGDTVHLSFGTNCNELELSCL